MSGPQINWNFDDDLPPRAPTPIEADLPEVRFTVGSVVDGAFELLEPLGRGGQGVVYRARDRRAGRDVALKLVGGTLTPRQRERFRREGELTAALVHPGIVKVHTAGEAAGVPYLAYELVEGCRTLSDRLDEADRATLVRAVRDAAEAVGHAHRHGVIHRDLKPDNLLVDADDRVRVADFGLARSADLETLTRTAETVGTPWYMAPEQFAGERERLGPPTDVWALGVILYRCLTGEPPFPGPTLVELMAQAVHREVAPRRVDGTIDRGLAAICRRALAKDPADRHPDAGALAADLDLALAGRSPLAARERARLPWGLAVGVAGAALIASAALAVRATWPAAPPPGPEPAAAAAPPPPGAAGPAPSPVEPAGPDRTRQVAERLRAGLRAAALARQAEDPRWPLGVALPSGALADRARGALREAVDLAAPGSPAARRARLALARLVSPVEGQVLIASLNGDEEPEVRLIEAAASLAKGEAALALEALDRLPAALAEQARAQLLRARALLALDRPGEALACARASATRPDADLGSYPQLRDVLTRLRAGPLAPEEARAVDALLGVQDEALARELAELPEVWRQTSFPPPEARRQHQRWVDAAPFTWEARFLRGKGRVVAGERVAGVRDYVLACARDPRLYGWLRWDLSELAHMRAVVGERDTVASLAAELSEATWLDRLGRAALGALQVEFEGGRDLTEVRSALDASVDEAPGLVFPLLARAPVLLRLDARDAVERDLQQVEEVLPDSPQLAFFRALLLARRGAPRAEVAGWIRQAEERGCREWRRRDAWDPEAYPEMAPYRGTPGLELFFASGR